jgi:RNA polymerase sigma-70 factor (ECF subfamily)
VRRYLSHLAGRSEIADDLLQETFLQMHRSRAAYNPAYAVRPWVFGLARNVFLMNRRAARRWANVHESREDLPEFPVLPEADRLGSRDEIRRCMAKLPPDQTEALLLHHEWGFTFEEIAGMLGISAAAARARQPGNGRPARGAEQSSKGSCMTDRSPKPPEALMRAIAQDLRPVRPSPRPLHLALRMVPLALLVSSVIVLAVGPRHDSVILGPLLMWGASAAQFGLAIALIWIAAHEGIPAGRLPRQMVYSTAVAAFLVVVVVTLLTFSTSPGTATLPVPPRIDEMLRVSPWIMGFACGIGSTIAGGILVLLFSRMFRNSLATRPTAAGALYGAGAGLAINAGWRIACPFSTPWHALGAHGAAIIATVMLGAFIGRFLGNRRSQIGGRRS